MQTLTAEKPKTFSQYVILNRGPDKTWPTASVVALQRAKLKVERVPGSNGLLFAEAPFDLSAARKALGHSNFAVVEPLATDKAAPAAA